MEVQLVLFMFILRHTILILGVGKISDLRSPKNPEKLQLCLTLAEFSYYSRAVVHFHRIIIECSCLCSEKIILLSQTSKKKKRGKFWWLSSHIQKKPKLLVISNMCKGLLKNKQKISLTHFVLDKNWILKVLKHHWISLVFFQ